MSRPFSWSLAIRTPLLLAVGVLLLCTARSAEFGTDLSRSELETSELRSTWETLAKENAKLQANAKQTQERLGELQKSLACANAETEVFKRQAQELKQRLEAMGLDGIGGNTMRLEQRLLKALNDLKVVEGERKTLQGALIRLSEAVIQYRKVATTTEPEARGSLEAEMRNAARALGIAPPETQEASAAPATLQDAIIISINEDLALVVANVGSRHGVKKGMPFQVIRADASIGTVRVVDVRERIAGAVIEDSRPEVGKISVHDRLKVIAQQ